nr:retrotransposon protein, putative, Ty1-copia subclass [Tanacetum cinerariifolium]
MSRQGASYFVTFTDDFSCYGYVYLLKHKHEVFETFKVFQKEVENQLGKTIKSLCSDRGGKYMSQEFLDHLKDHGIIAHRTPPYTPQHNGVSKRKNRALLDMVRSMMSQTTLPKSFWDYALETVARILNMVPTKKVEKTPYEVWHRKALKLSYLKSGVNSLIDQEASGSLEDLEIIQEDDTHPSLDTSLNHKEEDLEINEPQSDIVPIRRSTQTRHAPDRMCLYIDAEEHELGDLGEPTNYKAALLDPESKKWLNAMNVEIILIAIAAYYDYEIWQMDDKTAFLNGYLNEEEKLKLSKSQGASTPAEMKRMQNVPYALTVGSIMVSCYTDAGYLTNAVDLKSQTGYVFILNGGAVDWKRAIAIANESGITKGARHFRAKVHYLREVIEFGDIKLEKVHIDNNLADPFTKALAFPKHSEHTKNIGMLPASSLM